jgi:hypothetical protein
MVVRRPLVLSGQFLSEADNTDGQVILGSVIYGSGLGEQLNNYNDNSTINAFTTPSASGLIFTLDGSIYKLGVDGSAQILAETALASGNEVLSVVFPAYASGIEAQAISTAALSSGNAALFVASSGLQLSDTSLQTSIIAYSSGQAASNTANAAIPQLVEAAVSGEYAYAFGAFANSSAVEALVSGNAALTLLANNPFVSQESVIGLIFALG